jgi:hypothetical protein
MLGLVKNIVTCRGLHVTKLTGASSEDWVYKHFGYTLSESHLNTALLLIYSLFSSPLHMHWDSVSTSHLLATDLNAEISTSNHYEVLLFCLQSLWNLGTKNSSGLAPPAYD